MELCDEVVIAVGMLAVVDRLLRRRMLLLSERRWWLRVVRLRLRWLLLLVLPELLLQLVGVLDPGSYVECSFTFGDAHGCAWCCSEPFEVGVEASAFFAYADW